MRKLRLPFMAALWAGLAVSAIAAPNVTLTNPLASGSPAHYGYTQTIVLTATADASTVRVDFYGQGILLGSDSHAGGGGYSRSFPLTTLFNIAPFNSGEQIYFFYAIATDGSGRTTQSLSGSILVDVPPVLASDFAFADGTVNQPYSTTVVFANSYGTVSYLAAGLPPGLSIDSGTGLISGTPTQAGAYSVTLWETNLAGTGTGTRPITIQGVGPTRPTITRQPANQRVTAGQSATFSADANGTPTLTFQWSRNGTAISGATSASYTTPPTTAADNGAQFTVTVNNAANSPVTSNPAILTVDPLPTVATPSIQPNGGTFTGSVQVTLACTTPGAQIRYTTDGSAPTSSSTLYGSPITITVNTTLRTMAFASGLNPSSEASASFTINPANQPPLITQQPADQTVIVGQTAMFSVTASGTQPFSYQWLKNGSPISGATNASYTTPATTQADDGSQFKVTVNNVTNAPVTSIAATLTINPLPAVAQPALSPNGGTFTGSVQVTLTCATLGAQMHYTTDGSAPTVSSPLYTGPLMLTATTVLRVVAFASGMTPSGEASSIFVITPITQPPTIIQQPLSQTVTVGQTATFFVSANGTQPFSYQWFKNGSPIPGALTSSYTTPPASQIDDGSPFTVTINNVTNTPVTSLAAVLHVNTPMVPPTITLPPASQSVTVGQSATFTVAASGTQPFTYQWFKNGSPIGGATSVSYTTPVTVQADNGSSFTVTVNNVTSTPATSAAAILTVTPLPTVATPTITPNGGTFTGSVQVTLACATVGAQIRYTTDGSAPTSGSAVYSTPFSLMADTSVRAIALASGMNPSGEARASFTINPAQQPPIIQQPPASQSVTLGQSAVFNVTVSGTPPFTYQWSKNGSPIGGANGPSYTTPATTQADDGAQFTVTVDNVTHSPVTSAAATLTVNPLPTVATPSIQPNGGTFTGSVQVTLACATAGAQIRYTTNGTAPTASSTLYGSLFTLTANTTIRVVAFASGMNPSAEASTIFVINQPPTIAQPPASQTVTVGQTATFSVGASGTSPFSYQWLKNGSPINGAATSSYTTPPTVQTDNGASFTVTVNNVTNIPVTSAAAVLTVNPLPNAATPTLTPNGGAFTAPVQVTLACATPGAQIRYTTNGTPPTTSSTLYVNPFTLTTSASVRVIALATGFNPSSEAAATFTITIPNQPPTASFSTNPSPAAGNAPLLVSFNGSASRDPDGSIVSYDWDFGDGSAHGTGVTTTHTYAAGAFNAKLTVTDNSGASVSALSGVVANAPGSRPVVLTVGSNSGTASNLVPITVSFTPSPDAGAIGLGFDLVLPSGLALESAAIGSAAAAAGKTLSYNTSTNKFLIVGLNDGVIGTAGPLALLQLRIAATLSPGTYTVGLTNLLASDSVENLIPTTGVSGAVTVAASVPALNAPSLNIPATLTMSDTISVDYAASGAVSFDWTFTASPAPTSAARMRMADASSPLSRSFSGTNRLTLSSLNLEPGFYHVEVVAVESSGRRSPPAQADVHLTNAAVFSLSSLKVYPNPWRADRPKDGIYFENLPDRSTVKLFTISGHWMKTLVSSSGQVVWDLKNDSGDTVASGLYFYLVTDDQGGMVRGTIAVVR